jgi:HK97 family phage major capsid protein
MNNAEIQTLLKQLHDNIGSKKETLINVVRQRLLDDQKPLRKGEFSYLDDTTPIVDSELLDIADDLYLTSALLNQPPQSLNLWKSKNSAITELRKAMDTAEAGGGTEWIPTGFSKELIDRVRIEMKVATLHRRINMPTNPFKVPVLSADPTAYYMAESTSDEAPKFKTSQDTTRNFQFTAKKLAVRVVFSEEITEDSIVPLLPHLKDVIVKALRAGEEKGIIDGDTAATHQDSDVTDSKDARKAWNGYRKVILAAAKVDLSTFNTTNLRTMRSNMTNVYAGDPNKLAYVCSVKGMINMMNLTEVITVDKYGPKASILTGEIAKIDNIPVILSEYVRDNLNASGVYDGVTTSKSIVILLNRDAFMIGDRRKVNVKVWQDPRTDQQELIITTRLDFQSPFDTTSEKVAALGYNF